MATATAERIFTANDLSQMPDDGVRRWLIRGKIRENGMTRRNKFHSRVMMRIGQVLSNWNDTRPEPRGEVTGGEAGFILRHNPDSTVGIDVAYVSHEVASRESEGTTLYDGLPILAVEILSPSNKMQEITEKVEEYLALGVPLVWVVDTRFRTIAVYQPYAPPEMFNISHTVSAEPHLPGFVRPVAEFFR